MTKGRIEAFSDGVLAIILTIMVLELKIPQGSDWTALKPLSVTLLSYLLSFVLVATYWVNHHHLFQVVRQVNGRILWLNLHLLLWLSLVPFATAWLTQSQFAPFPVAFYGLLMLGSGVAFTALAWNLAKLEGPESQLARALGSDVKGKASLAIYSAALLVAFFLPLVAYGMYVVVAVMWFVPDTRIEKAIPKEGGPTHHA
jgi:uncharacterized membrane protein